VGSPENILNMEFVISGFLSTLIGCGNGQVPSGTALCATPRPGVGPELAQ